MAPVGGGDDRRCSRRRVDHFELAALALPDAIFVEGVLGRGPHDQELSSIGYANNVDFNGGRWAPRVHPAMTGDVEASIPGS
jgi:hypothetical protein